MPGRVSRGVASVPGVTVAAVPAPAVYAGGGFLDGTRGEAARAVAEWLAEAPGESRVALEAAYRAQGAGRWDRLVREAQGAAFLACRRRGVAVPESPAWWGPVVSLVFGMWLADVEAVEADR